MHIKIELRGYEEEKSLIGIAKKRIQSFIASDLADILMEEFGWENLEEDEEVVATDYNVHIYPHPDYEEERFFGC